MSAWMLIVDDDDDHRDLIVETIAAPVLSKPVDIDELLNQVARHCPHERAVRT